jgi:hypothetical protein
VVTFAPSQSLPANTFMVLDVFNVTDVAGNVMNFFQSTFTTGPITVSVNPNNSALPVGQTQQFTATVLNTSNPAVSWTITPTGAGSIDNTGLYTAPATVPAQSVVTVTATSVADPTKTASAVITVFLPPTSGYAYRRALTINHTKISNSDQSNFPVLISGTYSYLATVANGGKVQNANGYDIIFSSDPAGANKLDHEIESYDPATGTVNFWVRIPAISHTSDTVLYMQYGNSGVASSQENKPGVWSNGFVSVQHLSGNSNDSLFANNGTDTSMSYGIAAGMIGQGASFSGSGYISDGTSTAFALTPGNMTFSAWVNGASFANTYSAIESRDNSNQNFHHTLLVKSSGKLAVYLNSVNYDGTGSHTFSTGTWYHVAYTYDGSSLTGYVNGTLDGSANGPGQGGVQNETEWLGNSFFSGRIFNGKMDEVRFANIARSPDWLATEYNNQNSPSTFYSLAAENKDVIVLPSTSSLNQGDTQQFTAIVVNESDQSVIWSLNPSTGSIDNTGLYTAPLSIASPQVVTVTATSLANNTKTGSATINLIPPFSFHRTITIDHTKVPNTDENNFPVLVSGTYSFLATSANGGRVQSSKGYDIIFTTDAAGTNKLSHEIESFDPTTGKINFWVRVPAVSHVNDTLIYMQYGNSGITVSQEDKSGVWDSNFNGVWHLNGTPLSAADSTSNGFNGRVFGPTATTGEIDGAGNFSGLGQYIDIGNMGRRPTQGTISMWVNAPVLASFPNSFTTGDLSGGACGNGVIRFELNSGGAFGAVTGADNAGCGSNFGGSAFTVSYTANIWHLIALTWDSSLNTETAYYDGTVGQTASNTFWPTNFNDVKIGVGWDTSRYWNGQIDEVRMSNTARSADWIAAEYINQNSPASFYAVGIEIAH